MTRFTKVYGEFSLKSKNILKGKDVNNMSREGYGYIKRRVGLLSNELEGPTFLISYIKKKS